MSLTFTIDDLPHVLVMVVLASVLGYIAALLAGGRVPLGFFGTILFGVLGAWLANDIVRPRIPMKLPTEPTLDGTMLFTAGAGALVFSLLWCSIANRITGR